MVFTGILRIMLEYKSNGLRSIIVDYLYTTHWLPIYKAHYCTLLHNLKYSLSDFHMHIALC